VLLANSAPHTRRRALRVMMAVMSVLFQHKSSRYAKSQPAVNSRKLERLADRPTDDYCT